MVETQLSSSQIKNIWQQMCASLQPQLSPAVYSTWILAAPITEITPIDETSYAVTFTSPTAFHATNLQKNLHHKMTETLQGITGKVVQLSYKIGTPNIMGGGAPPQPNLSKPVTIREMRDSFQTNSAAPTSQPEYSDSGDTYSPAAHHQSQATFDTTGFSSDHNGMSPRVEQLFSEATLNSTALDRESVLAQQIGLRRDYTFSTFAVSTTNEMAHAAATAVSNRPGVSYNPLFLYGGVGVGKTHLMHAIGSNILHNNLNSKIIYCTGEEFTNEIVQAIQNKKANTFKYKFRNCDVLLIDDVQFIAGKNAVQEEFFHTFNALTQQLKQVVMTSDRPPQEIRLLEDRLRSRFEAGLMIDIGQPSFELRTAILLIKAKAAHLNIPIELAKTIAAKVDSARRIEGIIKTIRSEVELKRKQLDEKLVSEILKDEEPEVKPQIRVSPIEVIKTVANHFRLKQTDLKGKKRIKHVVSARHITMYVMKKELQMPLLEIGKWFSNRDHTSVLHAVRKVELDLTSQPDVQQEVSAVLTTLRAISR